MRHWAEEMAKRYLLTQGYVILAENYTVRGAEIDLIARKDDLIVVTEVKQRRSARFGTPAEMISQKKLARLQKAALYYVAHEFGCDDLPLRFDALLFLGTETDYTLTHLEGIS